MTRSSFFGLSLLLSFASFTSAQERSVDFAKDVLPLLKSRCFECHQGRNPSAIVRLDQRAEWLGETNGRPLATPGDATKSLVLDLVTEKVPGKFMPKKGGRLSAQEIAVLRAWITQGMPWEEKLLPADFVHADHWEFHPVVRPAIPKVRNAERVRTPVDAFILSRQEKANISPAATENAICSTAVNPLKVLVKSETCIMFLSAMVNQERNSYSN